MTSDTTPGRTVLAVPAIHRLRFRHSGARAAVRKAVKLARSVSADGSLEVHLLGAGAVSPPPVGEANLEAWLKDWAHLKDELHEILDEEPYNALSRAARELGLFGYRDVPQQIRFLADRYGDSDVPTLLLVEHLDSTESADIIRTLRAVHRDNLLWCFYGDPTELQGTPLLAYAKEQPWIFVHRWETVWVWRLRRAYRRWLKSHYRQAVG